jgi:RNA polymerase sigma-70 factor (ECF subfamily)
MAILERKCLRAEGSAVRGLRVLPNAPTPATGVGSADVLGAADHVEFDRRPESTLIERAREGDMRAFDAIVSRRLMPTFRLARAILGSTEEAEDATQDAFIAAWRGLPTLRDIGRFDAWFSRIVVNACRMTVRRRPRAQFIPLQSDIDEHDIEWHDPGLAGLDETDALQRAIDQLEVQDRAILALFYLEDRPLANVASILGIAAGTAKWRLHRARAALKRALDEGESGVVLMPALQPISADRTMEGGA